MIAILELIVPIFAVIGMGRGATKLVLISPAGVRGLTDFTFWVALPSLFFGSITAAATLQVADVAGAYLLGCLIVYGLAMILAWIVWRAGLARASMFALNATYGNVVFLATPIVSAAFDAPGVRIVVAIVALHSGILLPLAAPSEVVCGT
jgi:malonate transporter and related proteins